MCLSNLAARTSTSSTTTVTSHTKYHILKHSQTVNVVVIGVKFMKSENQIIEVNGSGRPLVWLNMFEPD